MDMQLDGEVSRLWQQQAREEPTLPLDEVRTKAGRLDAKTRRWRVITVGVFILLLIKGAVEVWTQTGTLERAGDLLLMAALVYVAYRYRQWRLAAPPVALGRTNCVEFYRAELVRQRDLSKEGWGYLLPFVPGISLAILDGMLEDRPAGHRIVLVLLGVTLFLGIAGWNAHTARKLENEIRALDLS
jgi:hypothetical protein